MSTALRVAHLRWRRFSIALLVTPKSFAWTRSISVLSDCGWSLRRRKGLLCCPVQWTSGWFLEATGFSSWTNCPIPKLSFKVAVPPSSGRQLSSAANSSLPSLVFQRQLLTVFTGHGQQKVPFWLCVRLHMQATPPSADRGWRPGFNLLPDFSRDKHRGLFPQRSLRRTAEASQMSLDFDCPGAPRVQRRSLPPPGDGEYLGRLVQWSLCGGPHQHDRALELCFRVCWLLVFLKYMFMVS